MKEITMWEINCLIIITMICAVLAFNINNNILQYYLLIASPFVLGFLLINRKNKKRCENE